MSSQTRHVYTREERRILEDSFSRQTHPTLLEKERLANILNCNIIQISNWFQNHRRRIKKKKTIEASTSIINSSPRQTPTTYHHTYCPMYTNTDNSFYYNYYPSSTPQCIQYQDHYYENPNVSYDRLIFFEE